MDDIKQHIYLPIPSLRDQPRPGSETRDERLKAIIANLEKQHQQVRNNIATSAIRSYQALKDNEEDHDAMDLDTPTSPPNDSGALYNDATFHLIANLNTPHDPKNGDPCMPPGTRVTAPPGVQQAECPEGMKAAKETLDRIAAYDQMAKGSREYYARALERRTSSSAGVGSGSGGGGMSNGGGPQVHPDRMRQVESNDVYSRRW